MKIKTTYICKGAIYCGFKPEDVEVKEERQVLYPEKGYKLERKSNGKQFSSIWLKDGDVKANYIEVKESKDDNSK